MNKTISDDFFDRYVKLIFDHLRNLLTATFIGFAGIFMVVHNKENFVVSLFLICIALILFILNVISAIYSVLRVRRFDFSAGLLIGFVIALDICISTALIYQFTFINLNR